MDEMKDGKITVQNLRLEEFGMWLAFVFLTCAVLVPPLLKEFA